jgi:hypothetical protein
VSRVDPFAFDPGAEQAAAQRDVEAVADLRLIVGDLDVVAALDLTQVRFRDNWTQLKTEWTPNADVTVRNTAYYLTSNRHWRTGCRAARRRSGCRSAPDRG